MCLPGGTRGTVGRGDRVAPAGMTFEFGVSGRRRNQANRCQEGGIASHIALALVPEGAEVSAAE